jgi:hypothetical protein
MFHDSDRHLTDYQERLLLGADAPWSQPNGLRPFKREAIRQEARRQQRAEIARWFGAFWRGLTGRG